MNCRVAMHVEEAGGASLHIGAIGTASQAFQSGVNYLKG